MSAPTGSVPGPRPEPPTGPEPTAGRSPRSLARRRRREALLRFAREYARNRAGMFGLVSLLVIGALALTAPLFIDQTHLTVTGAPGDPFQPPGGDHPLGTDNFGRSVLDLIIWGARVSLTVGLLATFVSVSLGTLAGITAGHFGSSGGTGGRVVASIIMRVTDWFLVLPTLVLAVALAAVLPRGTGTIILAIGLTVWPATARLVRAQTLAVEARPYVERARALGGGHAHVMGWHVLPNVMPVVLAQTTLLVATSIIAESTLAFLGMGDPTTISWGALLQAARTSGAISAGIWWYIVPPGLAIAVVALSFTLCGRAVEAVINPRLRGRS
ncbi:ABC transporter permease [Nocardiopsis alba]|uniref:ABC transporter permease n=2 Tax=Nocardiopsis alba TaxID=53437 RepID=A0A7K2IW67_9ACTN|nr:MULTISPECIES: ABC transporter permease [Nocardiopsis]AFR06185.1 binding--dependent transport system inner membrane component family protein [Nocardiopsis alba ATCC BAA-2165]MEC3892427.1 ABC transporter permease [Nocardiopsis sp. LDBS1602]MYR34219.1 ABC transporter permease subunit [Nocardiopsis alba]